MRYIITEKNGVLTARLPLALRDGRTLWISASASIADTYRELGLDPAMADMEDVGGFPGSLFKSIGKAVKKIAKSKVLRTVAKVGKSIIKSPITSVALGAVTGGAALPALAAANVAVRVAEAATKGGKKGKAARKLLKASKRAADKDTRRKVALSRAIKSGRLNPTVLANAQAKMLRQKIAATKRMQTRPTPARAADWLVNVHLA